MDDDDLYELGFTHVQFVGGIADGQELAVDRLKPEYHFSISPDLTDWMKYASQSYENLPIPAKRAIYVRLKSSTIYVYKRTA